MAPSLHEPPPWTQGLFPRGLCRTLPCEDTGGAARGEGTEDADVRVRELKDRLEQELQQQGEEQYRCILKRKEQHVAEVPGRGQSTQSNQPHPLPTKGFSLSPSFLPRSKWLR